MKLSVSVSEDRFNGGVGWQSRTVSAAPVAGSTSSAGEGSTASAGPFLQCTQCDCPALGPGRWWCLGT